MPDEGGSDDDFSDAEHGYGSQDEYEVDDEEQDELEYGDDDHDIDDEDETVPGPRGKPVLSKQAIQTARTAVLAVAAGLQRQGTNGRQRVLSTRALVVRPASARLAASAVPASFAQSGATESSMSWGATQRDLALAADAAEEAPARRPPPPPAEPRQGVRTHAVPILNAAVSSSSSSSSSSSQSSTVQRPRSVAAGAHRGATMNILRRALAGATAASSEAAARSLARPVGS
jgi:hypothetical protein